MFTTYLAKGESVKRDNQLNTNIFEEISRVFFDYFSQGLSYKKHLEEKH